MELKNENLKEYLLETFNENEDEIFDYLKDEFISNALNPCFSGWVNSIYFDKNGGWSVIERHNGSTHYASDENYFILNLQIGISVDEISEDYDCDWKFDELIDYVENEDEKQKILNEISNLKNEEGEEIIPSEKVEFIENKYPHLTELWNSNYLENFWDEYEKDALNDSIFRRIDEIVEESSF